MLQPVMHTLATRRLILASGSPRRKLILENIGLKFEVMPSNFEENLDKSKFAKPYEYAVETAMGKALEVAKRLCGDPAPPDLVIGADTVVAMDDRLYEKPADKQNAFEMLSSLSGRSHTVHTGVVLVTPKDDCTNSSLPDEDRFHINTFHEATDVFFASLDAETIRAYIETGEPLDKAGGYGIQAEGGTLVEKISGDYFNVMGFPLHRFSKELRRITTDRWT